MPDPRLYLGPPAWTHIPSLRGRAMPDLRSDLRLYLGPHSGCVNSTGRAEAAFEGVLRPIRLLAAMAMQIRKPREKSEAEEAAHRERNERKGKRRNNGVDKDGVASDHIAANTAWIGAVKVMATSQKKASDERGRRIRERARINGSDKGGWKGGSGSDK